MTKKDKGNFQALIQSEVPDCPKSETTCERAHLPYARLHAIQSKQTIETNLRLQTTRYAYESELSRPLIPKIAYTLHSYLDCKWTLYTKCFSLRCHLTRICSNVREYSIDGKNDQMCGMLVTTHTYQGVPQMLSAMLC